MALVYLAATALSCWAARRLGMPSVNGISAFMVPWAAVLCLASFPGVMVPAIAPMTWAMIWLASISVVIGVAGGWALASRGMSADDHQQGMKINPAGLARWHWIFVTALAAYTALQIARLAPVFADQNGWAALRSGNGAALKAALLEAAARSTDTTFGVGGLLIALLGYVLFLGNASVFTGAMLLRAGRPIAAAVPLLIAGLYSLLTLQRTSFVVSALLFIMTWVSVRGKQQNRRSWRKLLTFRDRSKSAIGALALTTGMGLLAVLYPLAIRNAGTSNPKGLGSLAVYLLSGVAGLNARTVSEPQWSAPMTGGTNGPMPGLGSYTFAGLFNILARLGLPVPQSPTHLDFYPVVLFGRRTTTNISTSLGDYFMDFGWAGLVGISLALALCLGYLQRRYVDRRNVALLPPVAFLLAAFAWSFFTAALVGDFRLIILCSVGALLLQAALDGRSRLARWTPADVPQAVRRYARTVWTRVPSGTRWMIGSYGAGFLLQGAYFVVLARTLGSASFGVFTGALALASTLAALAGLGAGNVLVMETARDRMRYRAQMGTALVYVATSFVPLVLIALSIAGFQYSVFLKTIAPLLVSELVFVRVIDYGLQAFQAHDMLRSTAIVNAATGLARLCAVGVFSLFGGGDAPQWAAFYAAVNIALAVTVTYLAARRFGRPSMSRASLSTTWRTGIFFSLGMASRTIYADADKFLLVKFGQEQSAGHYSAAYKLVAVAFTPIQALVYSFNTQFFRAGREGFGAVWTEVRRLMLPILLYGVVASGALILGSPLLPWILGPDYADATSALIILAPVIIFQGLHYLFGDALMGVGRQAWRSSAQMTVALLSLACNVALIPVYGWRAAAVTALGSSALLFALTALLFARGLKGERSQEASGRRSAVGVVHEAPGDSLPEALADEPASGTFGVP